MKHIVKKYTFPDETPSFKSWKDGKKLSKTHLENKSNLESEKNDIWKKFTKKTDVKNAVKKDLLDEQGYICCYCQSRINMDEKTQIEHFIARSSDPTKMFDYDNLLAGCDGGQKSREDCDQTEKIERIPKFCCHAKEDGTLPISPLEQNCEDHFDYFLNAENEIIIEGKTDEGKCAVEMLQLDLPHLNRLRGNSIIPLITNNNGDFLDKNDLDQIKSTLFNKINNEFTPFCVVIDSVLQKI
jgi:uncharacterized protein (TIGR02646 family)